MFYCPECGEHSATVRGELCKGCAYLESEDRAEYLYTTGEGRNELLGLNELSPDFYGDDYDYGE
jgi:ribosomal protein L37E